MKSHRLRKRENSGRPEGEDKRRLAGLPGFHDSFSVAGRDIDHL